MVSNRNCGVRTSAERIQTSFHFCGWIWSRKIRNLSDFVSREQIEALVYVWLIVGKQAVYLRTPLGQAWPRSSATCVATPCPSVSAVNGCVGAINCYAFNTSVGRTVCAPAPPCSFFDLCAATGGECPSTNYVCVVNSCCPLPICLPSTLIAMCSVTTTTTAATPAASTTSAASLPGENQRGIN